MIDAGISDEKPIKIITPKEKFIDWLLDDIEARLDAIEYVEDHEKEIDDWHARCLLLVEFIPALLCIGFISRCHIIRRLNVECVLNKCKQIDHKQCLSHESHQEAAYGKKEYAVGLRTYVTECK